MTGFKVTELDQSLRLVFITGGSGAGKTRVAHRLIGKVGKNWRLVQLDHYVPWGWKDPAVDAAARSVKYIGIDEKQPVIFEGAVTQDHILRICGVMGLDWPSPAVRVIQLMRAPATAERRRLIDPTLWVGWTEERKREGIKALETQVPAPIDGALVVETDSLTEDQEYAKVVELLRPGGDASDAPKRARSAATSSSKR
jgi:hypothetical protein